MRSSIKLCNWRCKTFSINIDCFETNNISNDEIVELIKKYFPLTPKEIITHLNLKKPIYKKTASYGHFGRTPGEDGSFSWEKTNKTELLREKFEEHTA